MLTNVNDLQRMANVTPDIERRIANILLMTNETVGIERLIEANGNNFKNS